MSLILKPRTDIFQEGIYADYIVNPVNTVGVMGAGLAKDFATRYPLMMVDYKRACNSGFDVGMLYTYIDKRKDHCDVINFPTKKDFRHRSRLEYIRRGLAKLVKFLRQDKTISVALPMLGCGCGGLEGDDVLDLMEEHLSPLRNVVTVCTNDIYYPEARIAIVGGRDFEDYKRLSHYADRFIDDLKMSPDTEIKIVSGGAGGADRLAERYAKDRKYRTNIFEAKWRTMGKSAGYLRNLRICNGCTHMIAFPDKSSKGTYHSVKVAKALHREVMVIEP